MPTFQDIRKQYPQYDDLTDDALAAKLHKAFYADMPFQDFAAKISFSPKSQQDGSTLKDVGQAALALGAGMANWIPEGLHKAAGAALDLAGVEGALETGTQAGEQAREFWTPSISPGAQRIVQPISDFFQGISDKSKQAADWTYEKTGSPLLATAARTAGEAIPFMPVPLAVKGLKTGVKKIAGGIEAKPLSELRAKWQERGVDVPVKKEMSGEASPALSDEFTKAFGGESVGATESPQKTTPALALSEMRSPEFLEYYRQFPAGTPVGDAYRKFVNKEPAPKEIETTVDTPKQEIVEPVATSNAEAAKPESMRLLEEYEAQQQRGGMGVPPERPSVGPSEEYKTFLDEKKQWDDLHDGTTLYSNPVGPAISNIKAKIIDPILNLTTKDGELLRDLTIRKVQDRFVHLKRFEEEVAQRYGKTEMPYESSAYKGEELMSGKVYYKLELVEKSLVSQLDKAIAEAAKSGVTLTDIDAYLSAKHAPGRNAAMQGRNQTGPYAWSEGFGSGWTPQEIATTMQSLASKEHALAPIAEQVYKINQLDLKLKRDYGLISDRDYQFKKNDPNFKFYVPLRGKEGLVNPQQTGKGLSVRKGWNQAFGRSSKATDSPLLSSVAQLEETIIRGEKNLVGNKFLDFINQGVKDGTLSPEDFKINAVDLKPKFNPKTGQVERVNVPEWSTKPDSTFSTIKDGKHYYITMEKHPLLIRAMNNLGADKGGKILQTLAGVNRYLAVIKTSFNPEFALTNPLRDALTGALNITTEHSGKLAAKIIADTPAAMRGVYKGFKWDANSEWAKYAIELRREGGTMGFFSMKDLETRGKRLEHAIKAATGDNVAKAQDAFRAGLDYISDITGAGENGIRLSAFVNLRKQGFTAAEAASVAKNLTVNFNRHGELGPLMNAGYLFFNANVQGTTRLLKAMQANPGKFGALGASLFGLSLAIADFNRRMMGEDEDGINLYDKIQQTEKARNLIIYNPLSDRKGARFMIPLPYGYNIFHATGQAVDSLINNPQKNVGDASADVVSAMVDSFNPLGNTANLASMISPTITDPIVELSSNRNWAGSPIMPNDVPFAAPKPNSQKYFNSVTGASKAIAQGLNTATGGNDVRPGAVDISPEWIDYMSSFLVGGAGDFFRRSADVVQRVYSGDDIPFKDVPLLRRFAGEKNEFFDSQQYIKNLNESKMNKQEFEQYGKASDNFMAGLAQEGQRTVTEIMDLNKEKKALEKADIPEAERRRIKKAIDTEKNKIQMEFNRMVADHYKKQRSVPVMDNSL